MAKPLYEVENPIILERPVYRSPEPMHIVYKPEPTCSCGCKRVILEGCIHDKDNDWYYYSENCVVNHLLSVGSYEIVDYTHKEAV